MWVQSRLKVDLHAIDTHLVHSVTGTTIIAMMVGVNLRPYDAKALISSYKQKS